MRIASRKLQLSRETVRRLDPETLRGVHGGAAIVSSDNKQCTYSKQCPDTGVIAAPDPVTLQPIGPANPVQPVG